MESELRPRLRAEWEPHAWMWLGFPSHRDMWDDDLAHAQAEVAALAHALHAGGRGEEVRLVAADEAAADEARRLAGDVATIIVEQFGDIWLRDTGPILVDASANKRLGLRFGFNGWGGKYDLPGDQDIGVRLARRAGLDTLARNWILEGGAIEVDGTGLGVTTEQCLLNPNRNPGMDRDEIERRLAADLGITRLLWLGEGLANDHTDGHVDNLARFVAPGRLALPQAAGADDPNRAAYADAEVRARAFGLDIVWIPSPGRIERDGIAIPASYMNFLIGNAAVAVPQYGAPNDGAAVAAVGALFPDRTTIGLRSDHLLTGGGAFHCISQQAPR